MFQEAQIFSEVAMCKNLHRLSITTQIDVRWAGDVLSGTALSKIVAAAWAPELQSLRIISRLVSGPEQHEVGEEMWMATLTDDHLVLIHETAKAAEKRLVRWSRALGSPIHDFKDSLVQKCYEDVLRKRMEDIGDAAMAAIDSSALIATRKGPPRKSKH